MIDLWEPQPKVRRILGGYGRGEEPLPVFKMPHLRGWAVAGRHAYLPAIGRHEVLVVDTETWAEVGPHPRRRPAGVRDGAARRPPGLGQLRRPRLPPRAGDRHADAQGREDARARARPCCTWSSRRKGEAVWISSRDANRVSVDRHDELRDAGDAADRGAERHLLQQPRRAAGALTRSAMDMPVAPVRADVARRVRCSTPGSAACRSCRGRSTRSVPAHGLSGRAGARAAAGRPDQRRGEPRRRRVRRRLGRRRDAVRAARAGAPIWNASPRVVNAEPGVNHNYEREHDWNLWFVVTAADAATPACQRRPHRARHRPARRCACRCSAPTASTSASTSYGGPRRAAAAPHAGTGRHRSRRRCGRWRRALERGLPLVARPFAALGEPLGMARGRSHRHAASTGASAARCAAWASCCATTSSASPPTR